MVNYAIRKESIIDSTAIDNSKIKGVTEFKLFKNENSIGNTLFIPNQNTELNFQIRHHSDLSFLLTYQFRGYYEELFITDEMRDLYAKQQYKEIIQIRKSLIQQKEREFIKTLEIDYED